MKWPSHGLIPPFHVAIQHLLLSYTEYKSIKIIADFCINRTKTCMISLQSSCRVNPRHESLHQGSRVCTFPSRTRAWEVLNICHLPHVFFYFALYKRLNHQKSVADIFSFTYINTKMPLFLQKPPHFRGVFMLKMADMWQKTFKNLPFLCVFDNFFDISCRGWDITSVI